MRIVIICREPKVSMSMDIYANALFNALKSVRPEWDIIQIRPDISDKQESTSELLHGLHKYFERHIKFPLKLRNIDADIFHIIDHSDGHFSYWLNLFNRMNVVTCHDLINLVHPETYRGRARFPILSMAAWRFSISGMEKSDYVISVSESTKKDIIDYTGIYPERISVVPNAVDSCFKPANLSIINSIRKQYGAKKDTLCLLNVGSNNIRKNISAILEAVNILHSEGLPIHFWKVGDAFDIQQLEFIRNNGLCSDIKYLGSPSLEELISIYSSADVLVAPSLYEGFGLTVLEAMACGTVVIAADTTSLPEVTGDAAILVNPRDIVSIANAIREIHEKPSKRRTLAEKGFVRAREFTWERTAEGVAQIYEKLFFEGKNRHS